MNDKMAEVVQPGQLVTKILKQVWPEVQDRRKGRSMVQQTIWSLLRLNWLKIPKEHLPEGSTMTDPYVIVDGGIVQNEPEIPVFDLSILESDAPGIDIWDDVWSLRTGMIQFPALAEYVDRCERWLIDHGEHDPSLRTIPPKPEYEDDWDDELDDELDDDRYHGSQGSQDRGLPR